MDIFKEIRGVRVDKLHYKFKLLRDEPYYSGARRIVEGWAEDFHDRDKKIAVEFQTSFHSALWELYLHAVLRHVGFDALEKYNRPDFVIHHPEELYVEAVVSEIKDGGRPERERTLEDHLSMLSPISSNEELSELIDEAISRHSNSILSKLEKYTGSTKNGKMRRGYLECPWVKEEKPYVIALASYDQVNYGKEYIYSMLALLYGIYYQPESGSYYKKESIKKPGTESDITLGIFDSDDMRQVSAVFFCNTLTLGKLSSLNKSRGFDPAYVINIRHVPAPPYFRVHEVDLDCPEHLLDGLYIFRNPNAKNKISDKLIEQTGIMEIMVDDIGMAMSGAHPPIVARYCDAIGHFHKEIIKSAAASNYNGEKAWEYV
jgi:hypothetical protein